MNAPRVVVLDDDPTGTQCTADIDVLLRPAVTGLPEFLASSLRSVFALTNTRAMTRDAAISTVKRIRDQCDETSPDAPICVLRGDSTLRGYLFDEMECLGLARAAGLLVPAYPDAGRVTRGGVHWVRVDGVEYNVADTEYARDPVFGFRGRTMADLVRELGGDRPVWTVPLHDLRRRGGAAVAAALHGIPDGGVVVPDAETSGDIELVAAGYQQARAAGRSVVLRCAAPLAALLAGAPGRVVEPGPRAGQLLVVCGSHTAGAAAQLRALGPMAPPPRLIPTDVAWAEDRADRLESIVDSARGDLRRRGLAIVSTERVRLAAHGSQEQGAAVMAALMAVVRSLVSDVEAIIAKGGITSAEVAMTGLGADRAWVRGQLEIGVSLWQVGSTPVAVVPGNIGDDQTLVRAAAFFGHPTGTAGLRPA